MSTDSERGADHAFGGAFSTNPKDSTDCSGLVLQAGAYLMGRTDWPGNRYGSTESFRLEYKIVYGFGFKRLPAGSRALARHQPAVGDMGLIRGNARAGFISNIVIMDAFTPAPAPAVTATAVARDSTGTSPLFSD